MRFTTSKKIQPIETELEMTKDKAIKSLFCIKVSEGFENGKKHMIIPIIYIKM